MESADSPVKVPTSTAFRTPRSDVSNRRNAACSGATCMLACPATTARVSAMRSVVTSSAGVLCLSR
jgi:hypothetical protein